MTDGHRGFAVSTVVQSGGTPSSNCSTPSLTQSLTYRSEVSEITTVALQYCLRVINQCERSRHMFV